MAPQTEWKKPTITAATNQLTEARSKIKEKLLESGVAPSELELPTPSATEPENEEHTEASELKLPTPNPVELNSEEHTEASRGDAKGPIENVGNAAEEEPVIQTVTQDAGGQELSQEAFVVTSTGPAVTVVQVQTVVGEAVFATVTGEAVAVTATQDAVPVTLWTVVEEGAPGGTTVALPEGTVGQAEPEKEKEKDSHKGKEGHKAKEGSPLRVD
jgi:hypothetical protein